MHLNQGRVAKKVFTLSTLTASCLMAFNSYAAVDCSTLETWDSATVYTGGDQVTHDGSAYSANYWNQNNNPRQFEGDYAQWKKLDVCSGNGGGGTPNEAPTASLTAPTASDVIVEGDNVVLSATALDADGSVASVEFFVDSTSVAVVTAAPFEAAWAATSGNHQISVVATDNEGAVSVTSAASISVDSVTPGNEAPTVSVALSAAAVDVGGVVTLTARAADSDGTVDKVDFYVAGALVGTAATSPYTLDYITTQAGSLAVYAKATDNQGATADSALASLIVNGAATVSTCRPDGLYQTQGIDVPYCTIYDDEGREKMGTDHPRRVIGYFTSWRAGDDPQAAYLVNDIPWEQLRAGSNFSY